MKTIEQPRELPFDRAVNINKILRFIDKAVAKLRQFYGTKPTNADFNNFVIALHSLFPASVRIDAIFASIMSMVGKEITREDLKFLVWRLAGNLDKLKQGIPVPVWTRQTDLEWVPIVIRNAQPGKGYGDKPGVYCEYRVLAGSPAGLVFTLFWTQKFARYVSKVMGLSKSRKADMRMVNVSELAQMRMYLLLDPLLSTDGKPAYYHFHVPSSCKVANRQILSMRVRITPCPEGFTRSELPCHKCPIGYYECPGGCHPNTYIIKTCPRCESEEGLFEDSTSVVCVDCKYART